MKRKTFKTEDYILLAISENQWLFAVQRRAEGSERFVKSDPKGKELGPIYSGLTYLISPFLNYETGRLGESCTCLSWRTRHKRCVHLKKFYEMNPQLVPHDIHEDTSLHPGTLAELACDELQKPTGPNLKTILSRALEQRAEEKYRGEAEFREKLAPCLKENPADGDPNESQSWLKAEMTRWILTAQLGQQF